MGYRPFLLKSLPNNILELFKLKALADSKRNAYQNSKFDFNKEENSVGIGENAGYQIESTCKQKRNSTQKYKFVFERLGTSH